LFQKYGDAAGDLGAITGGREGLGRSDRSPEEVGELFTGLASADPVERTLALLPVDPVGVGDGELYSADGEDVAEFMAETVGAPPPPTDIVRVQVLNGIGVPGVGQEVAGLLAGDGFRVVLSGNAQSFGERRTLIVAYDLSLEGQAVADRARDLLGVGHVQVSSQAQGIVDLTIVVGKDFQESH
jgi:polyisoprenyl-teichoic acid--peptidoglycan teichoic acid transferase